MSDTARAIETLTQILSAASRFASHFKRFERAKRFDELNDLSSHYQRFLRLWLIRRRA